MTGASPASQQPRSLRNSPDRLSASADVQQAVPNPSRTDPRAQRST